MPTQPDADLLDLAPTPAPGGRRALTMAGDPTPERADAARNRTALLNSARTLIDSEGVASVTMDRVAAAAGVGKGTVFRRFGSREGLMAALLNFSESAWQASVISGPAPLGPGAPPLDRLLAFGRSRIETTLLHAQLINAAGQSGSRSYAAHSFMHTHVRYLLTNLGASGDLPLLATTLLAPLEVPILVQQVHVEGYSIERIHAHWCDVVRRIVASPLSG